MLRSLADLKIARGPKCGGRGGGKACDMETEGVDRGVELPSAIVWELERPCPPFVLDFLPGTA